MFLQDTIDRCRKAKHTCLQPADVDQLPYYHFLIISAKLGLGTLLRQHHVLPVKVQDPLEVLDLPILEDLDGSKAI